MPHRRQDLIAGVVVLLTLVIAAGVVLLWSAISPAAAADDIPPQVAVVEDTGQHIASVLAQAAVEGTPPDQACRLCHAETDAVVVFPDGGILPVQVDPHVIANSAHGTLPDEPLNCTSCHAAADYQFPHDPVEADSLRAYQEARVEICTACHTQPHETAHPGPDEPGGLICTDCHREHETLTSSEWKAGAGTATCVECHTEREVEPADGATLTAIIQRDLFSEQVGSDYCLACHAQPGLTMELSSGEILELTVAPDAIHDSVHGAENPWRQLECTDCHGAKTFPHEPVEAATVREYRVTHYELCADCHIQKYDATLDDVHGAALAEGNLDAAVCTDCHGAHEIPQPDVPRARISYTCAQCHDQIFDVYAESVHGESLLEESNEDVPTCIDCHGVHDISDPTTVQYRVRSPLLCAECHADDQLMEEYGISTDVFDTYVADFHGTSAILFGTSADPDDPGASFDQAVCYDCHGVHDIRRPEDPDSGIQENLLVTCQKCHPDANENFPASWTSHYVPSLEHNPGIYLVNLFYDIVIPLTVGGLGFIVATDVYRRLRMRRRRRRGEAVTHAHPEDELSRSADDDEGKVA